MAPLMLADRAVISARGTDAPAFLQSLVSADVVALNPGAASPAALLTPQGKVLFDMIISRDDDGFLIDCRADIADDLAKRLSFYRLRSKVEICREGSIRAIWSPSTDAPVGTLLPQGLDQAWVLRADSISGPGAAEAYGSNTERLQSGGKLH